MAANPLLSAMMRPLAARTHWLFRLTAQRDAAQQCAEHEELYAAISAGQASRAAELAHEHVASGRETSIRQAEQWSLPDVDPAAVASAAGAAPDPPADGQCCFPGREAALGDSLGLPAGQMVAATAHPG